MKIQGTCQCLRIYIGESDRHKGKPLYQAIVEEARALGLAGATVLRGMVGFGANSHLHTVRLLRLSEDLPIVVELVDQPERLDTLIPFLDEVVREGLVTREKVEVVYYRTSGGPSKGGEKKSQQRC